MIQSALRRSTARTAQWSLARRFQPSLPAISSNNVLLPTLSSSIVMRHKSGVSMSLIKDVRERSGAPIVDVKKALEQSSGDVQQALDWLREHGAAKVSSKVGDREAKEGLVALKISDDLKSASLVQLASETDFAGRSSSFVDLTMYVADATLNSSDDSDAIQVSDLMESTHDGKKVQDAINDAIVSIRENLSVSYATKFSTESGIISGYVHGRILPSNAGTAAAVVEVAPADKAVDVAILEEIGRKLAMHIVAAKPQYLNPSDVPEEEVEKERSILSKQIEDTGKPPEIVTKIVEGRLRKFYDTVCLTEQAHMIEEGNPKISKALKSQGVVVKRFDLISIA